MNKKGVSVTGEIIFIIFGLVAAALTGALLLEDIRDHLELKTLERNFIARDLALTIDAIYAAPGEITYYYEFDTEFVVDIADREVRVRKNNEKTDDARARYKFIGDSNVEDFSLFTQRRAGQEEGLILIFHKHWNGNKWIIDVEPRGLDEAP